MEHADFVQIQNRYLLETNLLRTEQHLQAAESALRQAKFDLREAKLAQVEYSGSFKRFRDKLSGKQEETETNLRHAVQQAEANLAITQHQKDQLSIQLHSLKEQQAASPDWAALGKTTDSASREEWCRLECLYCIEALEPLLKTTYELLMERRNQFNGTYAGQIKTHQDLADIYSAPEIAGETCKLYLMRIKAASDTLTIPFELHNFFSAPTAFLSSATQYTRMSRVNEAISQAESLQRQLTKLQKDLSK